MPLTITHFVSCLLLYLLESDSHAWKMVEYNKSEDDGTGIEEKENLILQKNTTEDDMGLNIGPKNKIIDSASGTIRYRVEINKDSSLKKLQDLKDRIQEFPNRSDIPVRKFTQEFVLSIVPVIIVFLVLFMLLWGIFCTGDSAKQHQEYTVDSVPWDGFIESFFLVLKDCVSCCNVFATTDKQLQTPLIDAQKKFKAKLQLTEKQQTNDLRSRRASSVQRQTDSLRRLAATRDVTPRLQSPRATNSLLILADNQSLASETAAAKGSMIMRTSNILDDINNSNLNMGGSIIGATNTQHQLESLDKTTSLIDEDSKRRSANMIYDHAFVDDAFQQHYFPGKKFFLYVCYHSNFFQFFLRLSTIIKYFL